MLNKERFSSRHDDGLSAGQIKVLLVGVHIMQLTEESNSGEGLHLAAAVQYCGFRCVAGTMWAMADTHGPDLAAYFYRAVFSDGWEGCPFHERIAEALRDGVRRLRKKRGMTLERWMNFVVHDLRRSVSNLSRDVVE